MSVSRHDYSLHRRASQDKARHDAKVREAIMDQLPTIISDGDIVSSNGQKTVKVPIRGIELPHIIYDRGLQDGQGNRGRGAGNQPGDEYYEVELGVDEIAAALFANWQLPNLAPKRNQDVPTDTVSFRDVAKRGILSNMDKRRTILENMKRNAQAGKAHFGNVTQDDLRFKTWVPEVKPGTSAAVIAMRDCSGSMGDFEKFAARSFYFWMVKFLRTKYAQVKIVFINHHTEAKEVDENAFFYVGESGGTLVSSAYMLARDIIRERFPTDAWNIYPFHFSDGDNWGNEDNGKCVSLMEQIIDVSQCVGYCEVGGSSALSNPWTMPAPSSLMTAFGAINDPRFIRTQIHTNDDILPALKRYFEVKES